MRVAIPFLAIAGLAQALTYVTPYTNRVVFSPPSSYRVPRTLYARSLLIANDGRNENVLLSTWENYSPEPPRVWFPIYRSIDLGQTWTQISNITDTVNGWGLRYQPFLYELKQQIGNFPAGTIIAAGNSIPSDLSQTRIDIYASRDRGYTWSFVSHVASGGAAIPENGQTPIWEPFILVYNNQLVLYFSDQRDPAHGQKNVHTVTNDLINWGPLVNDVAHSNYSDRPGMSTVAQLPNGKWINTYEYGGSPIYNFAAYYRISSSPLTFQNATGYNIKATTGQQTQSSPYIVWTPHGGANGTLVLSVNNYDGLFLNTQLGAVGSPWTYLNTGSTRGYSRHLQVLPTSNQILLTRGGVLNGSSNQVLVSVVNLP